jgi:K+-sensing histidine kinase KdpD
MRAATASVTNESLKKFLRLFLVAIVVVVSMLAPVFALNWARQPFLGVLLYPTLIVSDSHNPNWPGHQQDIRTPDILQTVDGQPVFSGRDLFLLLQQKEVGTDVKLGFVRGLDEPIYSVITLTDFTVQDLLTFFWLPYLIGLAYFGLGYLVSYLRGDDQISRAFLAFCAFISIFATCLFDQHSTHFLTLLWMFTFPFIGASFIHLAHVFPTELRLSHRYPILHLAHYGVAFILGSASLYFTYWAKVPKIFSMSMWFFNFGLIGIAALIFFVRLLHTRTTTISPNIRQQVTIAIWGSAVAFGPTTIWAIAGFAGYEIQFSWHIFVGVFIPLMIFPLTMAYACLRYRIRGLDVAVSRGVIYALLTLLVSASYISITSVLALMLRNTLIFRDPVILVIFVVTLVIALGPFQERIQVYVSQKFLRTSVDYRQMLQNYGRELISTTLSIDNILEQLAKHASNALIAKPMYVFLRSSAINAFAIRYRDDTIETPVEVRFGLSDDLAQWLADKNDILQISPSGAVAPDIYIHREELARLNMLHVALCVPLLGSKRLLGWLAIGMKESGQPYGSDDLMFLATMASQTTIALENAQLLDEANKRAAELEALQQISVEVQAEAEPDLLLTLVVQQASRLLDAQGGLVWLLEPDEETLKVVVSHNLDHDYTGQCIKKGEGVAGRVLLLGEPVAVDNYQTFSGRSSEYLNAPFGAVLGVPLHWGGQVRGVLNVVHQAGRRHRFKESDIWLLGLFASQSAIALEKSQLLQEAQRRATQLAMLSEISTTISSTLNLRVVLPQVMKGAVRILDVEAGSLFLMNHKKNELTFEVVLGPTGSELVGAKIPVGVGVVGTVAKTRRPLIINDVSNDSRWHTAFDEETKFRTRDILCVPMIFADRIVGVIEIINKKDGTIFVKEDVALLTSFTVQAAIVIENAQIFTRTDMALAERVQELQTLQFFDQELQRSLELDRVVDITLTRAMDALGVTIGTVGIFKNQEDPGFYLVAQYGMVAEMRRYKTEMWLITQGVIGRVARTGKVDLINDVSKDRDYLRKSRSTESMLVVPITRDDRVIAVIDLESTSTNYFTEDDVNFVQLLASHAAIAIENAQLFEQVKAANQAKSEFMNTASHDLKVPMTSIKGYAKMLHIGAGGALSETQQEFVQIIYNNIERMDHMVRDLLDVSRIDAGRIRLELSDVHIQDVIDDVLTSVDNQIKEHKLTLNLKIEDNLPTLKADYNRLVQMTTNFVSNAYKYTPEGGQVEISARLTNSLPNKEQGISVMIKDTGFGISEEDQAQLFTNFFRSSDQNIRNQPGTGLGLSITKKMIESHGGRLQFKSKLGKGSSFTYTLPLVSKIPPGVEVVEK